MDKFKIYTDKITEVLENPKFKWRTVFLRSRRPWQGADRRERCVRLRDSTRNSGESGAIGSADPRHLTRCERFIRKTPSRSLMPVQIADNFNELLAH